MKTFYPWTHHFPIIVELSETNEKAKLILLEYYILKKSQPGVVMPTLTLHAFATLGVYGDDICTLFHGACASDMESFSHVVEQALAGEITREDIAEAVSH